MSDDDEDVAVCGACKKRIDSELELPAGWYAVHVAFGLANGDEEETSDTLCSIDCAKNWLDKQRNGTS